MEEEAVQVIQDSDTNFLYLSGLLPEIHLEFFNNFVGVLENCKIPFGFLPHTKDIWAKDFMPIQKDKNTFIQFIYDPDYLKPKDYRHLRSDPGSICDALNLTPGISNLIIDGGNVIKSSCTLILCEKVFKENPGLSKDEIVEKLKDLLEVEQIIFLPWDRTDFTGHADGMVRFIDDNTVFINEPTNENHHFEKRLRSSLEEAGLDVIEIPYIPPNDPTYNSAKGLHLNYLEMKQAVIVLVFNQTTDDKALLIFENVFKGKTVTTIDCNEIAAEGGVLNCISWNIFA